MLSPLRAFSRQSIRRRSTRLTAEGLLFLLFTLAVGVAAINTGNNLFYLLLAMMLSIILMSGLVAEHSLRRLELRRHVPDLFFAKEPTTVTVVVKNGKTRFPSLSIRLLDVVNGEKLDHGLLIDELLPGTTQLLSYPFLAQKRGRLDFEGIGVVTSFPFGLFLKTAYYPVLDTAVVSPEIVPLDEGLCDQLMAGGHEEHMHRRGCGNELYNLRLYHSGDDSRNIHWVSTAKTSQLIVRETEAEDERRATIHLVTVIPATHEAVFEEAVSFTASLVTHLSRGGYHLRLVAGSSFSTFGQGETHLIKLLHMLALCERRNPDTNKTVGDQSAAYPSDEQGAVLAIQPWDGMVVQDVAHPTVVFTPSMFARASYGVR